MKTRILSILLVLAIVLSALPLAVSAEEPKMVYITASDDSTFVTTPDGQPLAHYGVEISDLAAINLYDYGLEEYIYDEDMDGTPDITALYLYIYIHEVVLGLDWSEVTVTGSAGSIYFAGGLFGFCDENLRYDLNGSYPNVDGWGTTADRIVLESGDFINVAHYSDWAFWGDSATGFHYFANGEENIVFDYSISAGETFEANVIRSFSDWSNGGLPAFEAKPNFAVYYGPAYGDMTGSVETDDYGRFAIDFPEAGQWCIWTGGGYGNEYASAIVSAPAWATVNVKEAATEEPDDGNDLVFLQAPGLSFQDYIGMQVMISSDLLNSYDEIYVKATQIDFEKGAMTKKLEGFLYYFDMYYVFDQQILSWSMTEEVTLTLYAVKDGITYTGETFTASVEMLALAKLADNAKEGGNARLCTVLVDMLNYGATVQTVFEHNGTCLPNTQIDAYASYGTSDTPNMTAEVKKEGTDSVGVLRDSISMQSKVEIQLLLPAGISAYTAKAVMNGAEKEVVMDTETMSAYGWTVMRVAIGAAEMRQVLTIALYDADGNAVTSTYTVSAEAYAKDLNGDKADVAVTMMRYGDAVADFAAN